MRTEPKGLANGLDRVDDANRGLKDETLSTELRAALFTRFSLSSNDPVVGRKPILTPC